jgi:uncharacterized protein YbbK (DUF523 family)
VVVISRCIDFDSCRYNGQVIRASLRDELEPHIELRPICPELEIGLGVPRDPVRLVREQGVVHMLQPSTGRDLTRSMERFSARFLQGMRDADGFILKNRSPSCGVRDTKLFHSRAEEAGHDTGAGLFAAQVLKRFPHAAVEDEQRLTDPALWDQFLTKLFRLAAVREGANVDARHPYPPQLRRSSSAPVSRPFLFNRQGPPPDRPPGREFSRSFRRLDE